MTTAIVRVNPLAQLCVGLAALAGSFWVGSLPVAVLALTVYGAAVILFVPSWRYALACLGFSGVAALTVTYSTWRVGGHDETEALIAGLRILVLAWPGSVVCGYIDPARLADHLAQSLRLPARMVAAFSAALQRFADFTHAWTQLEHVRRARGLGPTVSPLSWLRHAASMAFAMLVHALRGTTQTAIAMDARGFASADRRTWAEPATWTGLDAATVAMGVCLGAVAPLATLLR